MAGAVITRSQFAAFMKTGLTAIFDDQTQKMVDEFTGLFHMETDDKAYVTKLGFIGMGSPALNAELELPKMDAPSQGRPVTYIHQKYSLGVAISFEAKDDDQYGKLSNAMVPELTKSFSRERNQQAADLLNNGFTFNGYEPDGVALFSASHPLVRSANPTTSSNLLTAPLSVSGLQTARALLRKIVTESGKKMPLIGTTLIVPPSLESLAEELVKSTQKPGQTGSGSGLVTTPSEVNLPWVRGLKVEVWNYLNDNGQWFLACDKSDHKINFYDRKKLAQDTIIDNKAQAVEMIARARWSLGFDDWRGIVGYAGS